MNTSGRTIRPEQCLNGRGEPGSEITPRRLKSELRRFEIHLTADQRVHHRQQHVVVGRSTDHKRNDSPTAQMRPALCRGLRAAARTRSWSLR